MEAFRRYRERYGEYERQHGSRELLFACAYWAIVIALESYYAKCVFMVMASIISHFLQNREVQLARQEVMNSIRTSVEQSIANVGTTIGTDTMRSMTNVGAYLKQLLMRDRPIAHEQSSELNEEEKRVATEVMRIMNRISTTPTSTPQRIHLVADAFEMDMACPSLLKKVPGLYDVVIRSIDFFRNRVRIVYHSNNHMPIGIIIWDEFHSGDDYVDAAYRLGNTMNLLERVLHPYAE